MRVLAVGATGQFAGLVVPALVAKGLQVRALVHDPTKADRVRELGAQETVAGDLRDRVSIDAVLDGVDAVFHITPAFAQDATELGVSMVEAARAAGVARFVFSSVYHPSLALVNHASVRPIEQALYRSGLAFTILQPAMFMQGLAGNWVDAVEHGVFAMPYSKDSAMTFVDYRDVAEVAAIAFATDELVGGAFELAAGGMLTRTEIAALMSRHAPHPVVAPRRRPGRGPARPAARPDARRAAGHVRRLHRARHPRRQQPRPAVDPRPRPTNPRQLSRRTRRVNPNHPSGQETR
jgi:uncharacterized protein YbjT (DUF2867 family)